MVHLAQIAVLLLGFFASLDYVDSSQNLTHLEGNHRIKRLLNGFEGTEGVSYTVLIKVLPSKFRKKPNYCAGALISYKHVLTIAHCVENAIAGVNITFGTSEFEPETTEQHCVLTQHMSYFDILIHPDRLLFYNDIALILLPQSIAEERCNNIRPIEVGNVIPLASRGTVCGWGRTTSPLTLRHVVPFRQHSDTLRCGEIKVNSRLMCLLFLGPFWSRDRLCAGAFTFSAPRLCLGDVGGPFVMQNKLVGLATSSLLWCPPFAPSVFVDTTYYYSWIQRNINEST